MEKVGFAERVDAFDISTDAMRRARKLYSAPNLAFHELDLEQGMPLKRYGLIGCMGVFSTIIDDEPYMALISNIVSRSAPSAFLITKDTTIQSSEDFIKVTGTSIRNYRSSEKYYHNIEAAGFHLLKQIDMLVSGEYANRIALWQFMKHISKKI